LSEAQKILLGRLVKLNAAILAGMKAHGHRSPPARYVTTFLLVALEPGLSVEDYAALEKCSKSTMSRHLLDIGDRNRKGAAGLGLVTSRRNPNNRRRLEYFLTPKGHALANQIGRYGKGMQRELNERRT
jgi:DNA-binding MarR family transcriptional regulator